MKKGFSVVAFTLALTNAVLAGQFKQDSPYVFAQIFQWQVREGGADMVGELISPIGTANPTVKLLDVPFKWDTGFRLGTGYKSINAWDTVLYYTGYNTKASRQITAPGQLYSPYMGNFFQNNTIGNANGPFYNAASFLWKINYNTLDFELGRSFTIAERLILRPFLGLKGASITQSINTLWQGPNRLFLGMPIPITTFSEATENLSNDFYGLGPSFGLHTTWLLMPLSRGALSLIGNFDMAMLWGKWRYKDNYQTNGNTSVTVLGGAINGAAPVTRAVVGLEWGTAIQKTVIKTSLTYEAQVWFDQMQFNTLSSGRLNDLMSLQGLALNFCINF